MTFKNRKGSDSSHSFIGAWLILLCLAAGCSTPIGVTRGGTEATFHALTANVLSAGEPSSWSKQVLFRNNLTEQFEEDPAGVLAELHRRQKEVRLTPDRMFALAELSFYYAAQSGKQEYYLAAAAYAVAFLLPGREELTIPFIDPRF